METGLDTDRRGSHMPAGAARAAPDPNPQSAAREAFQSIVWLRQVLARRWTGWLPKP